MRVLDSSAIGTGFKMLAHAFYESHDQQGIIGINEKNEIILMSDWNDEEKKFETMSTGRFSSEDKIVNIISQTLSSTKNQILVTTKDGDQFKNYLVGFGEEDQKLLFTSKSTPILVADPNDLSPLLIYSPYGPESGKIQISAVWNDQLISKATQDMPYPPNGIHTSWFLDLTGDMHADLALHITGEGSNKLHILRLSSDYTLKTVQEIKLASKIGPIVFSSMTSRPGIDMMYVSNDGGEFYLNLHENVSIPLNQVESLKTLEGSKKFFANERLAKVYDEEPSRTNLSTLLKGAVPVLKEESSGAPSGIFFADIAGSGKKSIYLLAKEGLHTRIKVLQIDPDTKELTLDEEMTASLGIFDRVTGVSVIDLDASGRESFLVNTTNGSEIHELIKADIEDPAERTGLTLIALLELPCKRKAYIPGASFFMVYENHEKMVKVSQSSQSSYLSLQRHREYVGLGQTNLFLNFVSVKAPHSDPALNNFDAVTIIVPNTLSVFTFNNRVWSLKTFFSKLYYSTILYSVSGILVLFFFIYLALSFQEMRKYKMVRSRDSMRPIFIAL